MDKYYWPIAFALMGFLFGNMGGSSNQLLVLVASGATIGAVFSILLAKLGARAKFAVNVVVGLLWAFLVFAVGFPSLRRANEALETSAVVYLACLSLAPLMAFFIVKSVGIVRSKMAATRSNPS